MKTDLVKNDTLLFNIQRLIFLASSFKVNETTIVPTVVKKNIFEGNFEVLFQ